MTPDQVRKMMVDMLENLRKNSVMTSLGQGIERTIDQLKTECGEEEVIKPEIPWGPGDTFNFGSSIGHALTGTFQNADREAIVVLVEYTEGMAQLWNLDQIQRTAIAKIKVGDMVWHNGNIWKIFDTIIDGSIFTLSRVSGAFVETIGGVQRHEITKVANQERKE